MKFCGVRTVFFNMRFNVVNEIILCDLAIDSQKLRSCRQAINLKKYPTQKYFFFLWKRVMVCVCVCVHLRCFHHKWIRIAHSVNICYAPNFHFVRIFRYSLTSMTNSLCAYQKGMGLFWNRSGIRVLYVYSLKYRVNKTITNIKVKKKKKLNASHLVK